MVSVLNLNLHTTYPPLPTSLPASNRRRAYLALIIGPVFYRVFPPKPDTEVDDAVELISSTGWKAKWCGMKCVPTALTDIYVTSFLSSPSGGEQTGLGVVLLDFNNQFSCTRQNAKMTNEWLLGQS